MLIDLYWRAPAWLLIAVYPLLWLGWRHWMQKRALNRYADLHLQSWVQVPTGERREPGWILWAFGGFWLLLALALAGPRTPKALPPGAAEDSGSAMVVLDASLSMYASDVETQRFAAAVDIVRRWLDEPMLPSVGLVVFAGDAHVLLPPTSDRALLVWTLEQLPQIRLPSLGNELAGALRRAHASLPEDAAYKHLLVLTDGDLGVAQQEKAGAELQRLSAAGVRVSLLALGSTTPTAVPDGQGGWLRQAQRPVLSARNDPWFDSQAGVAQLVLADPADPPGITEILGKRRLDPHAEHAQRVQWHEWFVWPLIGALVLLVFALHRPGRVMRETRSLGAVLGLALVSLPGSEAVASERQAYRALVDGDFDLALQAYRAVPGYAGRYGEGLACYRLEDYGCAIDAFSRAAWQAGSDLQRARAAFNLGNAFFKQGDYQQAVVLFEDARANGLDEKRTGHNLRLARELAQAVRQGMLAAQALRERLAVSGRAAPRRDDGLMINREFSWLNRADVPPDSAATAAAVSFDELLERGLVYALQSTEGAQVVANPWIEQTDAATQMSSATAWQRLLEIEAGFPLPETRPPVREGHRAW